MVVNTQALEDLPQDQREALLGSVDEALNHYIDFYQSNTITQWNALLAKRDIEQVTYTKQELQNFKKAAAAPAAQAWIEENTKRGLPAQAIYDFVVKAIDNEQ